MACGDAVNAQKAQIKIRDEELSQAQAMLNTQTKEIDDLKSQHDAFYKSPYLWAFVGLALGVYVGKK